MERRGVRGEAEWQILTSELHALKWKLHSKSDALLIISKDLDATQRERERSIQTHGGKTQESDASFSERFARQRVGDEGVGPRHFPAHEREELVTELEEARQQAIMNARKAPTADIKPGKIRSSGLVISPKQVK